MKDDFFDVLCEGASKFGVSLSSSQQDKFKIYKDLLKEWNKKINLTSITDDVMISMKHFVDSVSICPYINKKNVTLIDIGTGAGFPSLPVKIVRDDIKVVLLDSLEKRTKFLEEVVKVLGLDGVDIVHARAEDKGVDISFREKFDYACARAVAALPVLLEYCMPFVKVGGVFIAMKGSSVDEIDQSKRALGILGGRIVDVKEFCLPGFDYKRSVILVEKIKETPNRYPRKAGKPSKVPL